MPRRMEFNFVNPMAESIVTVQFGLVAICKITKVQNLAAAENLSEFSRDFQDPGATFPLKRFVERRVKCKQIVVD
jgi:hypothetical protein